MTNRRLALVWAAIAVIWMVDFVVTSVPVYALVAFIYIILALGTMAGDL